MTMYERIKQLRVKKGLSQQELANLTGYQDRSSIAKIESGVVDLPQSKILLFSKALDVSPAKLMGLSDDVPVDHVEDILRAPEEMRPELARRYGLDPTLFLSSEGRRTMDLTAHECAVIRAYRQHEELQAVVDRVLLLEPEQRPQPKQA